MIMSQSQSPDLDYIHWLPTELWELIATKYLKNPHDLYNLSDASPYFFGLLQQKRPQFLLQLVLPILGNPAGFLQPYLRTNDMLNFRLANRRCNQSAEYYFQEYSFWKTNFISEVDLRMPWVPVRELPPYYAQYFFQLQVDRSLESSHRWALSINRRTYIVVEDWMNNVLPVTHPPNTNANPIPSRGADFTLIPNAGDGNNAEERVQGIASVVTRFLLLYGRHFKRCTFIFGREIAMELKYSYLREWLGLTPNLSHLQVDFSKDHIIPPTTRDVAEWNGYIESNPMPTLPHLSRLITENLPYPIQQSCFQRYGHVETLYLAFKGNEAEKFGPVQLENLKTLKVEVYHQSDLISLKRCLTPSWLQLQTLEMDFNPIRQPYSPHRYGYYREWSEIISFLNDNFSQANRLVQLHLRFGKCNSINGVLRDTQTCRLNLRHIEQLKLCMEENHILVDFLLPMKNSLKKLAIFHIMDRHNDLKLPLNYEVDFKEKIAWNGQMGSLLLKSNIWTTFSKLNFLRVEGPRGWTYRRLLGTPIYISPEGKEVSVSQFDENVSEEEEDKE